MRKNFQEIEKKKILGKKVKKPSGEQQRRVPLMTMMMMMCIFIQSIKYNTILFYIIYKTERLKRYR